jgi:Icc protein
MLIHHITDLHVPDESDRKFQHVRVNVLKMMSYIANNPPDLLVVTGDLTMEDGSAPECLWLRDNVPSGINYIVIPGNHDDPDVLRQTFDNQDSGSDDFCFRLPMDEADLLFVNTHKDYLPSSQIEFIRQQASRDPSLLFMHHPPDLVADGFMARNQPLSGHAEVSRAITDSSIRHVFCGHYHNAIDKPCENFDLHLTPSPAFQVNLRSVAFKPEAGVPAIRIIHVANNRIDTRLHYL